MVVYGPSMCMSNQKGVQGIFVEVRSIWGWLGGGCLVVVGGGGQGSWQLGDNHPGLRPTTSRRTTTPAH